MKVFGCILALVLAGVAHCDTPATPLPYVTSSREGRYFFRMMPRNGGTDQKHDGYGIAFRVQFDGSDREVWRTEGWFSFQVFLSDDGHSLVALGPWGYGREPKQDDLAVAFYYEGKLIREYSTDELVDDHTAVLASTSHYFWLARDRLHFSDTSAGEHEPRFTRPDRFQLKTIDGITYIFRTETGEIVEKKKAAQPGATDNPDDAQRLREDH